MPSKKCNYRGCSTTASTANKNNLSFHRFPIAKSTCIDWLHNAAVEDQLYQEYYSEDDKKNSEIVFYVPYILMINSIAKNFMDPEENCWDLQFLRHTLESLDTQKMM